MPRIAAVCSILVVAAYRFVDLDDGSVLQATLDASAADAGLKGTLLIAPEGINFTLAGEPDALEAWLDALQADPRFAALDLKRHRAPALPFGKLRVRFKREIIRMNQPSVRPGVGRAPSVDATTLRRWLDRGHCDSGRPVVMLDTRNAFEVDAGAFDGALDWRLQRFSDFAQALEAEQASLQGKTVISYCTGGIRCEKAALWMAERGVPHVLQLEGGILRYLEQQPDAAHWHGHCFVFDDRVRLNTALAPQS